MRVTTVDLNHIHQTWPLVEGFIKAALDEGYPYPDEFRDYNLDNIKQFIVMGQWLLLVAVDDTNKVHGCATISFINTPKHRTAVVTAAGGKFIYVKDNVEQLKHICTLHGATKLQAFGKPSIVRLLQRLNFEPRNTLLEMKL